MVESIINDVIQHRYTNGKVVKFDYGCIVKNWYASNKSLLTTTEHVYESSSVDHFITDNEMIIVKYVKFEDDTPIITTEYSVDYIEILLTTNINFREFSEYKKYCNE
jgi:hypothetical protein